MGYPNPNCMTKKITSSLNKIFIIFEITYLFSQLKR